MDHKIYWCRCVDEIEEAHYLAAILNAPSVDIAIKAYQTRGIYVGPRDIDRRPFEVCPIPAFDASDPDHQRLAELSRQAHETVAALDLSAGGVVAARKKAREAARGHLDAIDAIARRMLDLTPGPSPTGRGEPRARARRGRRSRYDVVRPSPKMLMSSQGAHSVDMSFLGGVGGEGRRQRCSTRPKMLILEKVSAFGEDERLW